MELWASLRFSKFFSMAYGNFKKGPLGNRERFVNLKKKSFFQKRQGFCDLLFKKTMKVTRQDSKARDEKQL